MCLDVLVGVCVCVYACAVCVLESVCMYVITRRGESVIVYTRLSNILPCFAGNCFPANAHQPDLCDAHPKGSHPYQCVPRTRQLLFAARGRHVYHSLAYTPLAPVCCVCLCALERSRYLNSGTYIGFAEHIVQLLQMAVSKSEELGPFVRVRVASRAGLIVWLWTCWPRTALNAHANHADQ